MPLIESGTYTVNRRPASAAAKKFSKFTLWKHWRRSVQLEDSNYNQQQPQPDTNGLHKAQQQESELGVQPHQEAGGTASRREVVQQQQQQQRRSIQQRPHSLAVQPLNYQSFDPELQLIEPQVQKHRNQGGSGAAPGGARRPPVVVAELVPAVAAATGSAPRPQQQQQQQQQPPNHPNMTSQESIGSCSLDVERSASDRSDVNAGSLSEKTLHSLSISCNGDQYEKNGTRNVGGGGPIRNGHDGEGELGDNAEQLTSNNRISSGTSNGSGKKPSYLGLACSINGYSGITRYDSKLREGFRSRDSSPGARLITRDTSPAGFRTNENNLGVGQPSSLKSISPLAMDKRNGYSNGERHKNGDSSVGYSEVDRGYHCTSSGSELKLSPIRAGSPNKKYSPVGARIASYNQQNNRSSFSSISSSSPKPNNVSNSHNESSILNGSSGSQNCSLNSSTEKSFIQQRVERLYGPDDSSSIIEESLKNLPVLRHLRPEFRAQLPVVSPRKPTDGTEQIIKPLKRISIPSVKNDAKETKAIPAKKETEVKIDPQMTASVTSLTDHQPAAPKVVLPVDPVEYQANTPKRNTEAPKAAQEKDGHYFMSVLNKERERLISLAETAEAELENSDATLPEDAAGKLRSAAGKARLLATQKMKQFEGLCQKNINQVPGEEFPTTSEDLAGFWDMVMLQVVQVNDIFDLLERSKKLHWKDVSQEPSVSSPQNGSASKRRQTPASKVKSSTNSEALRKAREAREQSRKQLLEERRRAMRANVNKSDSAVEIFVPET